MSVCFQDNVFVSVRIYLNFHFSKGGGDCSCRFMIPLIISNVSSYFQALSAIETWKFRSTIFEN